MAGRHTLIAAVKALGLRHYQCSYADTWEQREQVESYHGLLLSMFAVVTATFLNAAIVIDCFHIVRKRCGAGSGGAPASKLNEAQKAQNKEKAMFKKKLEQLVKAVKYYRKKHPKEIQRQEAGTRKPQRLNKRFRPTFANGETVMGVTEAEYLLSVSEEKWTDRQKTRQRYFSVPKDKGSIYFDL